jgi:PTH1 family peptidyl-tRNA hydrolase
VAVGLGNPGSEFRHTRHNLGADVVSLLAERHGGRLRMTRGSRALTTEVRVDGRRLALAFPQTYVNESGAAVTGLVRRYGLEDLGRLVVVHDELDLPVGRVRVKLGGGTAGHNGLRSIQSHLHDAGFARVRIGIGKPPGRRQGVDHVLGPPRRGEQAELDVAVQEAADAVETILGEGVEAAMRNFNSRRDEP